MDDLLLDDQEYQKAKARRRIITIISGFVILALLLTAYAYDHFKPLPNNDYCEEEGFEAGIERYGTIMCYSDCPTNRIEDCKRIMAVRK